MDTPYHDLIKRGVIRGAVAAALGNGLLFLWWAGSSYSWGVPLPGNEILILLGIVALGLSAISIASLLFKKSRRVGFGLLVGSIIYSVSTPVALYAGYRVRMLGFERFTERAAPLIDAIHRYDKDHGHPPESLRDLTPAYMTEIPLTGVGSAPEYGYRKLLGDKTYTTTADRWMLQLNVSTGVVNWDLFIFLPSGDYPERGWGGFLERLGVWAYVYE